MVDVPQPVRSGGALAFAERSGEKFVYATIGGGNPLFYQYARFGPGSLGSGVKPRGNTYNWYRLHELYFIDEQGHYVQLWASPGACLSWSHGSASGFTPLDTIFCVPCDPHYGSAHFQKQVIAYSYADNDWHNSKPLDVTPGSGTAMAAANNESSLLWQLCCLAQGPNNNRVQSRVVYPWPGNWEFKSNTPEPIQMGAAIAYGKDYFYYAFFRGGCRRFMKIRYDDYLAPGGGQSAGTAEKGNAGVSAIPNPLSQGTFINFSVPEECHYRARIYNATGEAIRTLLDRELSPGTHLVSWNRCSDCGTEVSAGVYLLRLETSKTQSVLKLVVR